MLYTNKTLLSTHFEFNDASFDGTSQQRRLIFQRVKTTMKRKPSYFYQ